MASIDQITSASSTPTPASTSGIGNTLDSNAFLKLLVAQMKNQDPDKPADPTQFLAETAQFTAVQEMEKLATDNAKLLSVSQTQTAATLVGRSISWADANGADQTGVVTAVTIAGGVPTLEVGQNSVALDAVKRVAPAAT
jgi:flagellar basal-body rod modification protein FlgD